MSFTRTLAAVVALFVIASFDGVQAGEYDDRLAKAIKSQERIAAKIVKLQACVANPQPCAAEDQTKAQKAFDRAVAKLEKAKVVSNDSDGE